MSNYNNRKKSIAITVDAVVPGERKLVLKRLKPPPPHLRVLLGNIVARVLEIKKALLLTAGLFKKPELVRLVAPGEPPEPEHLHRRHGTFL